MLHIIYCILLDSISYIHRDWIVSHIRGDAYVTSTLRGGIGVGWGFKAMLSDVGGGR